MTAPAALPALISKPAHGRGIGNAPFLVWPVGLREFYASIVWAMLPTLIWGLMIFGYRALLTLVAALCGATLCHALLYYLSKRGKKLIWSHTLVSVFLFVGLSHPLWPLAIIAAAGAAVVLLIFLFAGPGNEIAHPALIVAFALTLMLTTFSTNAILVKDRLVGGDLANVEDLRSDRWPTSLDTAGKDAVIKDRPTDAVQSVFRVVNTYLASSVLDRDKLNQLYAEEFPWPTGLIVGVYPGLIGTVSNLCIVAGGLFLIYRNILRMRSSAFFLIIILLGLLLAPLSLESLRTIGWHSFMGITSLRVDEMVMLAIYELLGSDILFATVFIMAMPGTLPITRRGRRWFITIAALATAFAHRLLFPTPIACFVLLFLQPLAPAFDRLLGRKSWLDR